MDTSRLLHDRYRLDEQIAVGMTGPVFRGTDITTDTPVAVKVLDLDPAGDQPDRLALFRQEAAALRQLNHPNIVHFSDSFEEAGSHYLVMEFVAGGSIDKMLRAGPLPVGRVLEIGLDLADALARAHRLGIIHRDLKPQNILLASDGTPRLSDFGLAQTVVRSPSTESGAPSGTLPYMSPEALRGLPADERTDIWSLGIVLFEMLTGRLPFEADQTAELVAQVLADSPVDLSALRRDLPPALKELLALMLAKRAEDRIASVRLVGAALEAIKNDREATLPNLPRADARPSGAGRLPEPPTTFVGRARALSEVITLFEEPGGQLVTLAGPGGVGKTRLALEAARRMLERYADGLYFVDLSPVSVPELVAGRIAQTLGVRESGTRSLVMDIGEFFRDKRCLLLLDNFEQVIEAAPVVGKLHEVAANLDLLVTSREALHLYGEHVVQVSPLSLPEQADLRSPVALSHVEAVDLFIQRAASAQPGLRLTAANARDIADICIQLDGLPLAIELAAARARILPPRYLLEELRDVLSALTGGPRDSVERQRTLRATIDWSYRLLGEQEKKLFARLAVFRGGRTLEAIEAICMPGLSLGMFEGLESLVGKSLLLRGDADESEPRFVFLETIHQYAWQCLLESNEATATRKRHADYFAGLAERVIPELRGPDQERFLRIIRTEYDNVRAALSWSLHGDEPLLGMRLMVALSDFWYYEGSGVEGRTWSGQALQRADKADAALHARLLNSAGLLAFSRGDHAEGEQWHEQALAIARGTGDRASAAWALFWLSAHATAEAGKYESGISLCRQALVLFAEIDDQYGLAWGYNQIGELSRLLGRYEDARIAYLESLAYCRQSGNIHREAITLVNLGYVAQYQGHFEQAEAYILEGLALLYHLKLRQYSAVALATLAGPVASQGAAQRAATLLGASDAAFAQLAIPRQPADRVEIERYIGQAREKLDSATFQAAWSRGRAMTFDEAVAFAFLRNSKAQPPRAASTAPQ